MSTIYCGITVCSSFALFHFTWNLIQLDIEYKKVQLERHVIPLNDDHTVNEDAKIAKDKRLDASTADLKEAISRHIACMTVFAFVTGVGMVVSVFDQRAAEVVDAAKFIREEVHSSLMELRETATNLKEKAEIAKQAIATFNDQTREVVDKAKDSLHRLSKEASARLAPCSIADANNQDPFTPRQVALLAKQYFAQNTWLGSWFGGAASDVYNAILDDTGLEKSALDDCQMKCYQDFDGYLKCVKAAFRCSAANKK